MDRTGPQPKYRKLSAKVQMGKWARLSSGSEGQWPSGFPDKDFWVRRREGDLMTRNSLR